MITAEKIAGVFQVSVEVLEDFPSASAHYYQALTARDMHRWSTRLLFDEDWSSADAEMERLEMGRVLPRDRTDWDDEEEEE